MASGFDLVDIKKALFTSPCVNANETTDMNATTFNNRLQIEHETDDQYKKSQKDAHEKRMKKFRKMAKQLEEDDWLYPPVEKLIGLK
ncbi:anaphase-promoting complex subunit 16-like [Ruditapes philippinarum]|uniref:anaphase-promoting complex subunit 16-like n=1 Tax=Ruditapes philippinarum TaxID=129788 RepID=UPI00295C30F3|nr:anaphase-promoting complex subunit 16-like [Ruditapes philippinarum]